jgi:hypothetical protein
LLVVKVKITNHHKLLKLLKESLCSAFPCDVNDEFVVEIVLFFLIRKRDWALQASENEIMLV